MSRELGRQEMIERAVEELRKAKAAGETITNGELYRRAKGRRSCTLSRNSFINGGPAAEARKRARVPGRQGAQPGNANARGPHRPRRRR